MDTESVLQSIGYFGVFLCVFIECGVPLGLILPLPGYSMLFAAGVFASSGHMDLTTVIIIGLVAAIFGYIVGYFTGYKYGRKLFFEKKTKKYFTAEQGHKTEKFMDRFGYSTLIAGRFLPFVHNLAPILSGVARTPILYFMIANIIGALVWVISGVLLGFYIGQSVPNSEFYVIPFVILLMIFMNMPYGRRLFKRFLAKIDTI